MHDQPSARELIAAVRGFLETTARPQLSGHAAFHARVAENALAIVERELASRSHHDAGERARLAALLETDPARPLDALNAALSDAIRAGRITHNTPGLLEHLEATAIAQVEVDQPRYSGLAIATNARKDET